MPRKEVTSWSPFAVQGAPAVAPPEPEAKPTAEAAPVAVPAEAKPEPAVRARRAPSPARGKARVKGGAQSTGDEGGDRVPRVFYLDRDDLAALEMERMERILGGRRRRGSDLSALVREAIKARYGKHLSK